MGTNCHRRQPGKDWGDEDAPVSRPCAIGSGGLKAQVYVDSASPTTGGSQLLRYRNLTANASVNGVSEQYFRVKGYEIADGIAFSAADVKQQARWWSLTRIRAKSSSANRTRSHDSVCGSCPAGHRYHQSQRGTGPWETARILRSGYPIRLP